MNTIINFELKKIIYNKKNLIIIAIFFICIFTYLFKLNLSDDNKRHNEISIINDRIISIEKNNATIKALLLEKVDLPENMIKNMYDIMESNDKIAVLYNSMKTHIQSNDRISLLDDKIAINNVNLDILLKQIASDDKAIAENKIETKILTYLKDHKIEEIDKQASIKADNAIIMLLGYPTILIILIAFFMCSDIITSEFDNKTSYILFTQPVKKSKIFLGKFIISVLFTSLFFILFFLLLYIFLSFIKDGSLYNYPYMYYNGNDKLIIPAYLFIIFSFILMVFLIYFIITLTFFISSIFKNTITSLSVTAILIFVFYIISSKGLLGSISHFFPFSYFNIKTVINGDSLVLLNDTGVTFINGLIILILSSSILLITGLCIFKNNTKNI